MYRLAGVGSDRLRIVISNEMAAGLTRVFMLDEDENNSERQLRLFDVLGNTPLWAKGRMTGYLNFKITAMVNEIKDTEYEYTFDTEGEYILAHACIFAADELSPWESSAGRDDVTFVKRLVKDESAEVEKTLKEEDPDALKEYLDRKRDVIEETVNRCLFFPWFTFEIENDAELLPELIFWDSDFTMIDVVGNMKDFHDFENKYADRLGLAAGGADSEFLTGSVKFPIVHD